jgi:hypothetical protein
MSKEPISTMYVIKSTVSQAGRKPTHRRNQSVADFNYIINVRWSRCFSSADHYCLVLQLLEYVSHDSTYFLSLRS